MSSMPENAANGWPLAMNKYDEDFFDGSDIRFWDRGTGFFYADVEVTVLAAKNATTAEATFRGANGDVSATGASKRNNGDVYSRHVGNRLAVADALENLAREMRRSARA